MKVFLLLLHVLEENESNFLLLHLFLCTLKMRAAGVVNPIYRFFRSFVPWTHHAILYCCRVRSQMFYEKRKNPLPFTWTRKKIQFHYFFCSDIHKVRALYHSLLLWRICISRSSWAWRERKKKKTGSIRVDLPTYFVMLILPFFFFSLCWGSLFLSTRVSNCEVFAYSI